MIPLATSAMACADRSCVEITGLAERQLVTDGVDFEDSRNGYVECILELRQQRRRELRVASAQMEERILFVDHIL